MSGSLSATQDNVSDDVLLRSAKAGDEAALTQLIGRYAPLVRRRVAPFSNGLLDADDLFQEGMIALLKAVRHYREDQPGSFKTFALVCVSNKLKSALKAHLRGKNAPMRNYLSLSDAREETEWMIIAQDANPEQLVIASEQADARRRQISTLLSPLEQQVLKFYLSSYSYEEMAMRLGSSAKAVDNALQRVRRKLRGVFLK